MKINYEIQSSLSSFKLRVLFKIKTNNSNRITNGLAKIEIKNIFILHFKVNSALLTKVIKYIYVINPIKKYIVINVIVSI